MNIIKLLLASAVLLLSSHAFAAEVKTVLMVYQKTHFTPPTAPLTRFIKEKLIALVTRARAILFYSTHKP
jgi:hypothetical protein